MLWYLIVLAVFIAAFREFVFDGDSFLDRVFGFGMTLVTTFIAIMICSIPSVLLGFAFDLEPVKRDDRSLVVIRDKDGIEGRFFLGTGMIKSEQHYFYYYKLPDGGVQAGRASAGDGVRVYEENRADAVLSIYDWNFKNGAAWFVALPFAGRGHKYEFRVPAGTIRPGFTM